MPKQFCENCGAELEEDSVFCENCGAKAETPDVPKKSDNKPQQVESNNNSDNNINVTKKPKKAVAVSVKKSNKIFCENCGAELEADSVFCENCGAPVAAQNDMPKPKAEKSGNKKAVPEKKGTFQNTNTVQNTEKSEAPAPEISESQPKPKQPNNNIQTSDEFTVNELLAKAQETLTSKQWEYADRFSNVVLKRTDPEKNPSDYLPRFYAYFMKMCAEFQATGVEELKDLGEKDFTKSENYKNMLKLGDEQTREDFEKIDRERVYRYANKLAESPYSSDNFIKCKAAFENIPHYKDSGTKLQSYIEKTKPKVLDEAFTLKDSNNTDDIKKALSLFLAVGDNSNAQACTQKLIAAKKYQQQQQSIPNEQKSEQQRDYYRNPNINIPPVPQAKDNTKNKKTAAIFIAIIAVVILLILIFALVNMFTVKSIDLSSDSEKIAVGEGGEQLSYTITPNRLQDKEVFWSSSDENIATVSDGKVMPVADGDCTITATCGKKSDIAYITVYSKIKKIKISGGNLELEIYDTKNLKYTVNPKAASDRKVKWKSSDKSVATVDSNGKVKAVNSGNCKITVSGDGAKSSVTVKVKPLLENIILSDSSLSLTVGDTETIDCDPSPSDAEILTLLWESSDESVATVSQTGRVTAVSEGSCTITATANGSLTATVEVTVSKAGIDFNDYNTTWGEVQDGGNALYFTYTYDSYDYYLDSDGTLLTSFLTEVFSVARGIGIDTDSLSDELSTEIENKDETTYYYDINGVHMSWKFTFSSNNVKIEFLFENKTDDLNSGGSSL